MAIKPPNIKPSIQEALRAISSPSRMKKLGESIAEMIRTRTRLGFGVKKDGAPRSKLKALSESYKLARRGKLSFFTSPSGVTVPYEPDLEENKLSNKLSEFTSPTRSNLTLTGQMLESIDVTSAALGKVSVGPSGRRDDGLSNEKVADFAKEGGREFLHLSNVETKRVQDEVVRELDKELQKKLTRIK